MDELTEAKFQEVIAQARLVCESARRDEYGWLLLRPDVFARLRVLLAELDRVVFGKGTPVDA